MRYDIRHIEIPFRFHYGHQLKQHRGVEAVVCKVEDADGARGWGEAVPREYVTGETCESVLASVEQIARQTSAPHVSVDALVRQRIELAAGWDGAFPSCALCALDIARCDLWSSQRGLRMADWLGDAPCNSSPHTPASLAHNYCASIGFGRGWKGRIKLAALAALYRQLGFQRFKVKVGNDDDEARVRFLRQRLGAKASIFADANTAWDRETAIARIEMLAKFGVWAIEEPLQWSRANVPRVSTGQHQRLTAIDDKHLDDLRWLRSRSPIPIIADESLICLQSLRRLLKAQAVDLLNIRLSKCGGPLLSQAMIQETRDEPLKFAVAAMVGETPILASAGAHFAAHCESRGAPPQYVQGYSHGLLHRVRFATGEPKLRRATAKLTTRPGLGLDVNERLLDTITRARLQFSV